MKKLLLLPFLIFVAVFISKINAQDMHFSQVQASPLLANPAFTGMFNGNLRVMTNYRSQWESDYSYGNYKSTNISLDAKIRMLDQGNLSGGFSIYTDRSGSAAGFSENHFKFSGAYHLLLNNKNVFASFGTELGLSQKSLNQNNTEFASQFNGLGFDSNLNSGESIIREGVNNVDFSVGAVFHQNKNSRKYSFIGLAFYHLSQQDVSLTGRTIEGIPMKVNIQMGHTFKLAKNADLIPSFYGQWQSILWQINTGMFYRHLFEFSKKGTAFKAISLGSFVRLTKSLNGGMKAESAIAVLKLDYDNFTAGLSYDLQLSPLVENLGRSSAFELSFAYTTAWGHPYANRGGSINCPRF